MSYFESRRSMYQPYYPIGSAGHRNYAPFGGYGNVGYPAPPAFQFPLPPPPPPHYVQPPMYSAAPLGANQVSDATAVTGGISAVLEYEPQNMAGFVCWCTFGMLNQNRTPSKDFEASIVSILHATRLPKSTIIVALEYINQRFSNCCFRFLPDSDIFLKIVVAAILANKFNDDNTFTNKSWSGASGLTIEKLNSEEAAWLKAVSWKLNVVHRQQNIETLDECWRTWVSNHMSPLMKPTSSNVFYSSSASLATANLPGYSSIPSSPMYSSTTSAGYSYSSSLNASPIKFGNDWGSSMQPPYNLRHNPYAPSSQPSIWAYPPSSYQAIPSRSDAACYGYANPYYNCLASC